MTTTPIGSTHSHSLGNTVLFYKKEHDQWQVWSKRNRWESAMVNVVDTKPNGDPFGLVRIDTGEDKSVIESKLKSDFLPLIQNENLLMGAILMAFATQADTSNPEHKERAESFALYIASKLIRDILKIDISDEQIIESQTGFEAIGAITEASLKLAHQGLLIEESVAFDACPYLRVRNLCQ